MIDRPYAYLVSHNIVSKKEKFQIFSSLINPIPQRTLIPPMPHGVP